MKRQGMRNGLWIMGLLLSLLILAPGPLPALADDPDGNMTTVIPPGQTESPDPPGGAADPAVDADWWSTVQEQIEQAEYAVTWQEQTYLPELPAAYQAPNRAHNLRTYFAPDGLTLIPRTWTQEADIPPWRLGMALGGCGRTGERPGGDLPKSQPAELVTGEATGEANRIEYRRGDLIESYRNDENGLEQDLTFLSAPVPEEGLLRLDLAVTGGLAPRLAEDATADGLTASAIDFGDGEHEPVLRYSVVAASDASGRTLSAWLALENPPNSEDDAQLQGTTLSLVVDDTGAAYPITVSLTLMGLPPTYDWWVTYTQDEAQFGYAVATAGDVNQDGYSDVIVGAPYFDGGQVDEGLAMVFHGSAAGLDEGSSWYKESDQPGARFGFSVATAGDVDGDGDTEVIVGAPDYDHGETDEGGAWVYYGSPGGLSLAPGEFYQGTQAGAACGISVATAGDVNGDGYADVIVGASLRSDNLAEEGYALVYYGSASGLSNGFNWHAEGEQSGASLGRSVATAGDVNGDGYADVIVGADRYDDPSEDEGEVFVWYGSEDGPNGGLDGTPANANWSAQIDSEAARFGWSVSSAGDVNGDGYADVIVGAPYYGNGQANEGAARLYLGSATGLNTPWDNHDEGNQDGAHFGQSVATAGDVNGDGYADVIVGAPYYANGESQEGRAWVWHGSADGISAAHDWMAEGNADEAWYGYSVATAGDVNGDGYSDVIVGAPGRNSHGGSTFAYYGAAASLDDTAGWTKVSNLENAHFGHSVASAGDVNADGYGDVIVGAPQWDGGQAFEGSAWVYIGHPSGLTTTPIWHKQGDQTGAQFGWSVGSAGDVNGDGYEEVIVGAPTYDYGEEDEGMVWVYLGSASGPDSAPAWYKDSDQVDAQFGYAVGTAGDVNGDGYADVVVGAPYYNHPEADEGGAWIYEGSASGLHVAPDWHGQCDQAGANFGASLGTAGDVNGDGYSDLIVGAPFWDNGQNNEGGVWVYLGSPRGMSQTYRWRQDGDLIGANYGAAVGAAGDVNGDGFADIIVGAPRWNNGQENEGKAFVYHSSGTSLYLTPSWTKESDQSGAMFGGSVGSAGDVNGDGFADIIVGAYLWTAGQTNEGGAWVYHGSAAGVHVVPDWHAEGEQTSAHFGTSVATAGDVNGDAYADVIIGVPWYESAHSQEGEALIFYGNGGKSLALRLHQEASSGRKLARLGRLLAGEDLWLGSFVAYPFGRTKYRWEIETKPLRVVFDGHDTYIHGGEWMNSLPGSFVGLLGGYELSPGTPYHWRLRLRYNPATTPFMPASRWVTIPWNGWNEEDFRTSGSPVRLPLVLRNSD
jgi:hypothetical protein